MDDQNKTLIFTAKTVSKAKFPYKPFEAFPGRYVGYFENQYGEQWLFIYDRELKGGIITGSDIDWGLVPLGNGKKPENLKIILNEAELYWLMSCWIACEDLRSPGASASAKVASYENDGYITKEEIERLKKKLSGDVDI